ncbi:hypothetical protein ACIBG4_40850 [Nonomuraea sp. NPDC050383]|uniref:RapZ C-terminal domain-containing protein n=1 Tax=Nonomuraea sp. NPDC050383 TaxID=3364362 RepID=UPI00379C2F3B
MNVTISSFGYGHAPAPTAHITLDLRHNLRNPHHDPALRYLTGLNEQVRQHVLDTPGARTLIDHTAALTCGLLVAGLPVSIATGCVGGRHRSVAVAEEIAAELREAGAHVHVEHRDIAKPVLQLTTARGEA